MKELQHRVADRGLVLEWADVLRDLEALRVARLRSGAALCELRSTPQGAAGAVLQAVGVALGPSLRFLDEQIGVGGAGYPGPSPLRTGRAGFPHPALRSVGHPGRG